MKASCFLLFSSLFLMGQDFQSYYEEFDVVLYQLQVNVRDKDGAPIKGLKKEDFEVYLKGQLQEIQVIEEYSAEGWVNNTSAGPMPQQARRLFVFFFDLRYTTKKGVLASREAAREFVQSELLPTDLVSVFVYNPVSGVSMLTNFTDNEEHLLQAIDWLGLKGSKNVVQGPSGYFFNSRVDTLQGELGVIQNRTEEGGDSAPQEGFEADAIEHLIEIAELARRAEQKIYQREVSTYINSFEKFADGLRLIRGRKNLVWFSSGFDARSLIGGNVDELARNQAMIETGQHYNVSTDQFGSTIIQHEAQELVEHLQTSGTVIFAIDTSLSGEASSGKEGIQTLNLFAKDTGGEVYQHYANLSEPLKKIKDLTNDYYLLSFYPNAKMERGEVGNVKIKIKDQSRAKITTTKGIMVEPDFSKLTKLEKQIQLSEYIGRDQVVHAVPIQVNTFQVPATTDLIKLSVGVELRGDYFLGIKNSNKPRPMEIHILAVTPDNQLFDRAYFQFSLEAAKVHEILDHTGVKYFGNLFLKEGDYKLKVVVRDLENGKIGSSIQKISIANPYEALHGPTLLTDDQWILLADSEQSQRQRRMDDLDVSYPFIVKGNSLVPKTLPLVSGNQHERFFFMISGDGSLKDTPPNFAALIMDKDGNVIPIPSKSMTADAEYRGGARNIYAFVLKVDFESLSLKSGENYKLMAQFKTKGGQSLRATSEFLIE